MSSMTLQCSIDGCSNPSRSRGWCCKHYQRWSPYVLKHLKGGLPAREHPTTADIVLAAGWFEGEGTAHRGQLNIVQKDRWMTDRLMALFGGAVYVNPRNGCGVWTIGGTRARGFAMSIYRFLSPRRQERIRKGVMTWA